MTLYRQCKVQWHQETSEETSKVFGLLLYPSESHMALEKFAEILLGKMFTFMSNIIPTLQTFCSLQCSLQCLNMQ